MIVRMDQVGFAVEDIDAVVAGLRARGAELVAGLRPTRAMSLLPAISHHR
ncbi:hypothetical protein [Nonomuraea sp. B19D2]